VTIEYLKEQKEKYQRKEEYFSAMDFGNLANDFQSMIDLIDKMENYIKEKDNGQDSKN
jgi:hypothetical protein